MQDVNQALVEVKDMFREVVGQPAPEIDPHGYCAFPAGVDPVAHAVQEVDHLKRLSKQAAISPTLPAWIPRADSFVAADAFVVLVEVPGVARENLKVFVAGGECLVRGERTPPSSSSELRPVVLERAWGPFERRFVLPAGSHSDRLEARYREGILELRIPMEQAAIPKETRIDVR